MTEAEWQASTHPWAMLEFLEPRASGRKLLLFAAACCRRARPLGDDPRHLAAIEAAERHAAGELDAAGFHEAFQPVCELWSRSDEMGAEWPPARFLTAATRHMEGAAEYAADFAARGLASLAAEEGSPAWLAAKQAEEAAQVDLARDLFGDPSRPFAFDPAWLAGGGRPAVERAQAIEREGRFADLAPLAEALERAGCRDRAVLDHCRGPGPHARGCWVVDALLGREPAVRPGLLTEADWIAHRDPTSLLHFLRDKGTGRRWRLFAVACCRRIGPLLADDRSRRAVEVAARHAAGLATDAELAEARAGAELAQREAKRAEYAAEAEEDFKITPRYAAISQRLFAARAARSAVNRDPRLTDDGPGSYEARTWGPSHDWAVAAARWGAYAHPAVAADAAAGPAAGSGLPFVMTEHGKLSSGPIPAEADRSAEALRAAEAEAQTQILRDLFGALLGPPGDAGAWLPRGPGEEWWCRLPAPRRAVARPGWLDGADDAVPRLAREIDEEEAHDRLPELADALERAGGADPALLDHLRSAGPHFPGCWAVDLLLGRP